MFDKLMLFLGTTMVTVGGGFSAMALQDGPKKATFQILGMILSAIGGAALLFAPKLGSARVSILVPFLALLSFAVAGCGGAPTDTCAMNPIAHGCDLESTKGAVINGFKTTPSLLNPTYSYLCDSHVNDFSGTMKTDLFKKNIFDPGKWQTRFDAVNWANPLPTRNSLKPRFNTQSEIPMEPAMDGPYHVLYNLSPSLQYGLVNDANGTANAKPVIIPAYGIWIYAPGERPDFPTGAEVITFDPDPSVPFAGGDGRCNSIRVQAVSRL